MGDAESKWKSTALLVIGMQKDFILPSSPVHVRGAEAIVGSHIIWPKRQSKMGEAELQWNKAALLVMDMQKDFILPSSPIHLRGAEAIGPNVVKAVEVARGRGIHIIWVVREHDSQGRDVELLRRYMYATGKPKPVSKGSDGAELVEGLVIEECDYKLVKTRFSAFFNTHLHSYLKGIGVDNLIITGIQTPNCIRQTVFDAVSFDYSSITVIVDATAAATPDIYNANILDMSNVGVVTPTLEEWCVL